MVSVIVPVYRSEQTLERCVKSLLAQDYENIEILLIVDGPPDGSGILADELAKTDARIRVINQVNQGVSRARNRGIAEARGRYIRFLDSDDYVGEHSISPLVEQMEKDGSDIVIAGYDHLYFGSRIPKTPHVSGYYPMESGQSQEVLCRLHEAGFLNMPWNKLFRREKMTVQFPTDRTLGEDLLFNMQYMSEISGFSVIQDSVCMYIQDDRGTTLSTKKRNDKIETALYLYQKSKEFFLRLGVEKGEKLAFLDTKVITTFLDEVEMTGFSDGNSKERRQEILSFAEAARDFVHGDEPRIIRLDKLDYKIIYFFLKRKNISMTMFMVWLRTIVVKLVRKGRRV
nr:glycosyltransferase family 2 protein [Lachnospiraceae bacterium]